MYVKYSEKEIRSIAYFQRENGASVMTSQKASQILANVAKEGRKSLLETEAKAICTEYAIPVTKFELAKDAAEAARFAEKIGFPIVLKIVSPDIIHKSDIGGVVVNLKDVKSVEQAYAQIMKNVKTHCPKARIAGPNCGSLIEPIMTSVEEGAISWTSMPAILALGQ